MHMSTVEANLTEGIDMSVDATRFVWKLSKSVVTPIEKLILLSIADRCGERGECWPSVPRLALDTNLSEDAVRRHRNILIEKGILSFTGEYAGRSKQIPIMKLMIDEWREDEFLPTKIDPTSSATPGHQPGVPHLDSQGYPPAVATQNLKEESKKEPNYISAIYKNDFRFMKFYSEYPRKEKPRDAYKAFKSVVGNDDQILEMIIADIRKRISEHDQWKEKRYIPYPATYLRSADYESEILNSENEALLKKQKAKRISDEFYAALQVAQDERAKFKEQEKKSKPRKQYIPIKERLKQYSN